MKIKRKPYLIILLLHFGICIFSQHTLELVSSQSSSPQSLFLYSIGEPILGEIDHQDIHLQHGFQAIYANNLTLTVTETKLQNIILYPNPVSNELMIDGLENEQNLLFIHNSMGKLHKVKNDLVDGTLLDVSDLQSGIYFLTIQSNLKASTFKFIKL